VQHPPTTQLSQLHQQPATRAVYDIPPAIESSRRLLVRALLRPARRRTVSDPMSFGAAAGLTCDTADDNE
jgi:hypothetical protein